jgi:heme exporter protein D
MSWSEFFSMGGYAFYVWGSYAIALLALGGEALLLRQRSKALKARFGETFRPQLSDLKSQTSDPRSPRQAERNKQS